MSKGYIPLWCKSHYSFLEGASAPEELVEACHGAGLPALALCDQDGVYGVVRASKRARELGVRLHVGSTVRVEDESEILLLARNETGYERLCALISRGRLRSPKGSSQVTWGEVAAHAEGLLALWGGTRSLLARPQVHDSRIAPIRDAFGVHLFAMVTRHRHPLDAQREAQTRRYAQRFGMPLVGATEVLYHHPDRRELQDVMTCIRERRTLHTAGAHTRINAEHALRSAADMQRLFHDAPELLDATHQVDEQCRFSIDQLRYRYPADEAPGGLSPTEWLRKLTFEGAKGRYAGEVPEAVRRQLERELALIEELDYGGYFLTMKELVDLCADRNILCQGRGSAANSAVCYCLGITAIDPVRMGLLFERFLSRERAEPPDIDLDIAHNRREEVIQYMYERFGRERAAMVANVIRYRPRSAIRDVGTALGVDETALDRAAKLLSHRSSINEETLENGGLAMTQPLHQHLLRLTNALIDAPRHLSIHPGGFLLGDGPIHRLVPIENGAMEKRTVIQWDKYDVEDMGLFKVDLLGLGALTQLDACFALIAQHYGQTLSMATLPKHCDATFEMLGRGETVGVFQIESRAQMSMLPRLRPRNFYDLVIQISIMRPGPITGGMVHPYLRRRAGEEPVEYPHPKLRPVLERTLGVPLFQEQVMRLAMVAADYTPGEADQLRRDMGAWRASGRMEQHRERLVQRMVRNGIEQEFAERVFAQILGFGEYGFPESHAASFALIAWASAWLRRHFPEAFTASLLNAQPMGFYSVATLIQDAKRNGVEVRPICVLHSDWDCSLEDRPECPLRDPGEHTPARQQSAIRLGFRHIKAFRPEDASAITEARRAQPFRDLEDLMRRTQLREDAALRLAQAGAFDGFGLSRRDAIWQLRRICRVTTLPLFEEELNDTPEQPFAPLDALERTHWDHAITRMSAGGHALEALRSHLQALKLPDAAALAQRKHGSYVRYAGLVIVRQRPGTAGGVVFLTLEDERGFVNVIIWQRVWERYHLFVRTHDFLGVSGHVQRQHDAVHVIAEHFWAPKIDLAPPPVDSYDFH